MARTKERLNVSMDKELVKKVKQLVKKSSKYRNASHFAEHAISLLLEEESKSKQSP